ncbi:MAG TPA: flippase activity-associated protein Agl23 [Pyrinomonadaceae bacterium]|nr:flippase activity-associated protein Agl23 [Pyrinomonadaceae bacterium]
MSTRSTKSGKKRRVKTHPAETENLRGAGERAVENGIPDRIWLYGVIAIFLIAAILRFYDLSLVPLHHDEGVNGNFLVRLMREGAYRYDPENYHGPTLYYFSAIIPWTIKLLFGAEASETYGLTTFNIRLVTVVFGLATIGLVFLLRKQLGTLATLSAGLLLAVSPGAVYLSRYFIHETLFVFFTLGIVVAAVWFYEERNTAYLVLGALSAALLFATKETAFISAGVLIIALACTYLYRAAFAPAAGKSIRAQSSKGRLRTAVSEMGGTPSVVVTALLALVTFATVWVLFYSSFFQNSNGIYDSFKTFAIWKKTGSAAHVHPATQYITWLVKQEGPLLFLGAAGAVFAVLKPRNSLALFCALWSFGLIAAYSMIGYKTPWLLLNFVVPLALIAGYAIQAIYEMDRGQLRGVSVSLIAATSISVYQCIDLNFKNFDNDNSYYVYVYAHTKRNLLDMVKEIDRIAKEESGGTTGISVVSPDYWPLPWYLRNYSRVGYFGRMASSSEPLIIANANQKDEMETRYGELYEQVVSNEPGGTFELRPGVDLLLYRRR